MFKSKEFDALVAKMCAEPFPSRNDILKALSLLDDEELRHLYLLVKDSLDAMPLGYHLSHDEKPE